MKWSFISYLQGRRHWLNLWSLLLLSLFALNFLSAISFQFVHLTSYSSLFDRLIDSRKRIVQIVSILIDGHTQILVSFIACIFQIVSPTIALQTKTHFHVFSLEIQLLHTGSIKGWISCCSLPRKILLNAYQASSCPCWCWAEFDSTRTYRLSVLHLFLSSLKETWVCDWIIIRDELSLYLSKQQVSLPSLLFLLAQALLFLRMCHIVEQARSVC